VRNIFALTSVLEQHNLQVVHAENGRAGIEVLLKTPDVDAVLTHWLSEDLVQRSLG